MEKMGIEFIKGERLDYAAVKYAQRLESPFSNRNFLTRILTKLVGNFSVGAGKLIGHPIYLKKRSSPIDNISPKFHKLVSRLAKENILGSISYPKPIPGWPQIPAVHFALDRGLSAAGYGFDYDVAATKALAELIERYSLAICDKNNLIFGSWEELKSRGAVNPRCFGCFSEEQLRLPGYENHRFDENSKFAWVECRSLSSGKTYFIPAQLAHLRYEYLPGEPRIREANSSGAAAGNSREMAIYNALCEAVERDSYLIHWLNKIAPPKFDLTSSGNEIIKQLAGIYKKYNIDVSVFDITTDIAVPSVLTLIRDNTPGRPSVFVSPRADLDLESAVAASLIDGLRAGYWPEVPRQKIAEAKTKSPNIESIEERRAFWCDKTRVNSADFLFGGPVKKIEKNEYTGADFKTKLKKIKEIFGEKKLEVYLVNITAPLAREFGLFVFMSLVPEFYPMYLNENNKCLGSPRLYEAPVKMGTFAKPKKEEEINLTPHPML